MRIMAHIHAEPGQHDLTASAFIIRVDGPNPRVLLHMHKKLNRWMHMGGHVELDETPWAAVIREIREESGYELNQLRLLQPPHALVDLGDQSVSHPLPLVLATHPYGDEDHYHTDTSFVFVTKEEPRHAIAEDESASLELFSREDIQNLSPQELSENMRVQMLYIFNRLLPEWETVDPTRYAVTSRRD